MRWKTVSTTLALGAALLTGCAQSPLSGQADAGWTTLFDSNSNLNQWTLVGDANWRIQEGALQADYLRSKGAQISPRVARLIKEFAAQKAA